MAIIGTDMNSYFAHDSNAREDARMITLQRKHGYQGIGIYWALIELLRQNMNYEYQYDPENLAYILRVSDDTAELIESIILNFDLFEIDPTGRYFFSYDLNANMEFMESKRQKLSESGAAGAAVTNFKLYGIVPDNWTDTDINKHWRSMTREEQTKALNMMTLHQKDRLEKATNG